MRDDRNNDQQDEIEVSKGDAKIRVRGYDVLTIFVVAGLCMMLYMMFNMQQTHRDIGQSIRNLSISQREMACIISLPQDALDRGETVWIELRSVD